MPDNAVEYHTITVLVPVKHGAARAAVAATLDAARTRLAPLADYVEVSGATGWLGPNDRAEHTPCACKYCAIDASDWLSCSCDVCEGGPHLQADGTPYVPLGLPPEAV